MLQTGKEVNGHEKMWAEMQVHTKELQSEAPVVRCDVGRPKRTGFYLLVN